MSATLTWFSSGLGAKTGTAIANVLDDLETLLNSKLADANFSWRVASKNSAATPYYIVLKRKDGSAGRILIAHWSSAPAGVNPTILTATPNTSAVYISWFPNGNTDTPLNLAAASGTILGDDTDCTKMYGQFSISTFYTANNQPCYFDSAEAVAIQFVNPGAATVVHGFAAGNLFVDSADNAYGGVFRMGTSNAWENFGAQSSPMMPWYDGSITPTTTNPHCVVNYGTGDKFYFPAFIAGAWANHAADATDVLTDAANSKVYFVPVPLLGRTKGEGFQLKLRQIAWGPGTTAAFAAYSSSGPVVKARQFNGRTAGGNGFPWFTNFKL